MASNDTFFVNNEDTLSLVRSKIRSIEKNKLQQELVTIISPGNSDEFCLLGLVVAAIYGDRDLLDAALESYAHIGRDLDGNGHALHTRAEDCYYAGLDFLEILSHTLMIDMGSLPQFNVSNNNTP